MYVSEGPKPRGLSRVLLTLGAVLLMAFALAACGGDDSSSASGDDGAAAGGEATETTTVKVAMTPFLDYMPWAFAKEKGLDADLGVELDFTWLAQVGPSVQAMKRGDVDIVNTCTACNFPFFKSVPSIRDFLIANQFKGFNVVGRAGAPSYDALIEEGKSPEEARQEVFDYIDGKTVVMHTPVYGVLLDGILENAGLPQDAIKRVDFADDIKSATAFLGGEGDLFMGGLPQNIKLLLDNADKFVNLGGTEILGPGGLWYSTIAAEDEWLAENEEVALKLMAIWYRVARYLDEQPDEVIPIFRENVNAKAASSFTPEQAEFIVGEFLDFPTVEESKETVFNPDSELYWRNSLDHYEALNKKNGDLDEDIDAGQFSILDEMFEKLTADKELMDWINADL